MSTNQTRRLGLLLVLHNFFLNVRNCSEFELNLKATWDSQVAWTASLYLDKPWRLWMRIQTILCFRITPNTHVLPVIGFPADANLAFLAC